MTPGEITTMLNNINSIQLSLDEASGSAVMVETRMRLIGELNQQVRNKIKELVVHSKRKGKSTEYWDCELSYLDDAIDAVFQGQLEPLERNKIQQFRGQRNALLHGNFVDLMELMDMPPTGRHFSNKGRNILENKDIKEAILSISRNQGFQKFLIQAKEVVVILDKLILSFGSE